MDKNKQLIRDITSSLGLKAIPEEQFNTEEGRSEIVATYKLLRHHIESLKRRVDELENERQDLYDRTDMMEFAEYVARLYDLTGIRKWTNKGEDELLNKTVSQILIEFENDRKLKEKEELSKKELGDILFE